VNPLQNLNLNCLFDDSFLGQRYREYRSWFKFWDSGFGD